MNPPAAQNQSAKKPVVETPAQVKVDPKTGKELLHVKLYSPFQTYYNQDAYSLSGANATGAFDILPRHHNFMTLLEEGELTIRAPEGEKIFKISRAVMHIKANQVTIFLDI